MKFRGLFFLLGLLCFNAEANEVFIDKGNVYFKNQTEQTLQLSNSGNDIEANLSSDGQFIAFIRDTPNLKINTGSGEQHGTELWLLNTNNLQSELLVRGKEDAKIENTLAALSTPRFSSNNRFIYFSSAAWATSSSIQKVDVATHLVSFITDGNSLDIIEKGKLAGHLLIQRAIIKFDKNGDSLGRNLYLWLFSPEGKAIKEIGQIDSKQVETFMKKLAVK
jgi:Tol biopolymer transport system component